MEYRPERWTPLAIKSGGGIMAEFSVEAFSTVHRKKAAKNFPGAISMI